MTLLSIAENYSNSENTMIGDLTLDYIIRDMNLNSILRNTKQK